MIRRFIVVPLVVFTAALLTACGETGSGSSPNAASGSPASSAHKQYQIGQAMTNDAHQSVTVTAFKRGVSSGNEFEQPSPGHECIQTDLLLVNGDTSPWNYPLSEMTVVDSNGQSYQSLATIGCGTDPQIISGLVPKGKATASIRFEVPTGIALLFTWTPSLFNQNSTYQTQLK